MILAGLVVVSGSPVSAQPESEDLIVRPAPGSATDPGNSFFVLQSRPGRTERQVLLITNEYERPVDLTVTAVDAITASKGGVAFELPTERVDDEGSWLNLGPEALRVGSGEVARVPFQIEIPEETESGVHLAGIAVQIADERKREPSPTAAGAVVDIQSRFVVAVQVNLPGDATPELVISGVEPVVSTSGVTLEVLIENVGFGLAQGEGVLELPEEGFEEALPLATFVPGTSIRYPVAWQEDPAEGEYRATVNLSYSEDDPELLTGRISWEGTFVIGEAAAGELDRLQGAEPFNWLLVAVPGAILLLLIAFLLWRRRGKTASKLAGRDSKPAPAPAPGPQHGHTSGYTGAAQGTFGSGGRSQNQPTPQPKHRPTGTPPPPPPPPKQGT